MDFSPETLRFVVCPQCNGDLRYTQEQVLFCVRCRLCYPISDGVPHLSLEQALPLSEDGKMVSKEKMAFFTLDEGPNSGVHFRLSMGQCVAIGRRLEDTTKTQVFNIDFTMSLDDHTKNLILNYLSKTTGKKKKSEKFGGAESGMELGSFKRLPDLVLTDAGVSRLHAMLFYDENGLGILDLVSKNGTFVNGKEVETCFLKPSDQIRLGATQINFILK